MYVRDAQEWLNSNGCCFVLPVLNVQVLQTYAFLISRL